MSIIPSRGGGEIMPGVNAMSKSGGGKRKYKGGLQVIGGGPLMVMGGGNAPCASMQGGMITSLTQGGGMGVPVVGPSSGGTGVMVVAGGAYTRRLRKRTGKARAHRTKSYSAGGRKRRGRKTRKHHRRRKY